MSKNKSVFIILAAVFTILMYYGVSIWYFGRLIPMGMGNNCKNTWDMEELRQVAKDFELNDEGCFVSSSPDPWFDINESFSVRTIIVNVKYISDVHDSQVFYYSDDQELDSAYSYFFKMHEGLNYVQIPYGNYTDFRLDLTDTENVSIKIKNITTYGNYTVPAAFLL